MELIEGSPEVVCDAGPLIHLHEVDCLDLLSGFAAIWVPDAVLAEVEQHRPAVLAIDSPKLRRLRTDTIRNPRLLAVARAFSLHRGEMAALACLQNRPQAILLTDDAAARMAAQALGRAPTGRSASCFEPSAIDNASERRCFPSCDLCLESRPFTFRTIY